MTQDVEIGLQRRWLARQLLDETLTDAEAYSVVAFRPAISPLWRGEGPAEERERYPTSLQLNGGQDV